VPGGQQVYITPAGRVKYTQVHSGMAIPENSFKTGFSLIINPGNIYGSLNWVQPAANGTTLAAGGFASCIETGGSISVWARTTTFLKEKRPECSEISLGIPLLSDGSTGIKVGEVWQYD
jgi:hypothetical protein